MELKYKLVVSDFDGTLLDSNDTVSDRCVSAIKNYLSRGGKFVVSTGRMLQSILKRLPDLGITSGAVMALQGGVCADIESGKTLFKNVMDSALIKEIFTDCKNGVDGIHVYDTKTYYAESMSEYTKIYAAANRMNPIIVQDICRWLDGKTDLTKVAVINVDNEKNEIFYKSMREKYSTRAQVIMSARHLTEFIPLGSGKESGLKRLAELYTIDLNDTVAIGDELNDLGMIKAAGLGVAMQNARDGVKSQADYVTLSNDDDGVADLLEKITYGKL